MVLMIGGLVFGPRRAVEVAARGGDDHRHSGSVHFDVGDSAKWQF